MRRRLKYAAVGIIVAFALAQLVRPQGDPPTDESRTIQAHLGKTSPLVAVLDRSCGDCHSNHTAWPWYAHVAPLSWVMASGVAEGRRAVNFSEWTAYPASAQRALLSASCRQVTDGKMPGSLWTTLRPEARLSAHDIETICKAAHPTTSR